MNWTYTIKNKILASAVLFVLCLLVLLSHYLDRVHTQNVKNSIVTLYEDRLIAEDYILKMTGNIYEIREVLYSKESTEAKANATGKLFESFNDWYKTYMQTKLTATEKATAIELKNYTRTLEQQFSNNNYAPSDHTEKALLSLSKLSTVQIEESKLIMKKAESEYVTIKASSQFAFAIIITILLVLQALVFSAKTLLPVTRPKDPTFN